MTKEEVAEVVAYCDENKISYKQRLTELGISDWSFYSAKRKYAPKQEGDNSGDFLPYVSDEDVKYIVDTIRNAIID